MKMSDNDQQHEQFPPIEGNDDGHVGMAIIGLILVLGTVIIIAIM